MIALKSLDYIWYILPLIVIVIGFCAVQLFRLRASRLRGSWMRRLIMSMLVSLILLRPAVSGGAAPAGMSNIDVIFAVDTTASMAAEDYNGKETRLSGIRSDIKAITEKMAGARYTLLTFDSESSINAPLTTDATAVASLVDYLHPQPIYYGNGSTISQPVDMLAEQFKKMRARTPERSIVLYYLGDGEQTSKEPIKSFSSLSSYVDGGAVLGYGTEAGGPMKIYNAYSQSTEPQYIKNYTSFPATNSLSKINQENLQTIADQLGVNYVHRTAPSDIDGIIKQSEVNSLADRPDLRSFRDLYPIPAAALALLVLYDSYISFGGSFAYLKNRRRRHD